ncbi:MAG: hypothetical protein AAF512_06770 [Pseudomonadota bacterium]
MKKYIITEALFARSMQYARRGMFRIFTVILLIMPVPLVGLSTGFNAQGLLELLALYLVVGIFLACLPLFLKHLWRRVYQQNPLYQKPQSFEISAEELHLSSDNGESHYKLSELKKIDWHSDLILIWPTTTLYHMIPFELLTEQDKKHLSQVQSKAT